MEGFGERLRPLECRGLRDHTVIGMLREVGIPDTFLAHATILWPKRCMHCPLRYVYQNSGTCRSAHRVFPVSRFPQLQQNPLSHWHAWETVIRSVIILRTKKSRSEKEQGSSSLSTDPLPSPLFRAKCSHLSSLGTGIAGRSGTPPQGGIDSRHARLVQDSKVK